MRDLLNLLDNVLSESAGGMAKRWLESQRRPIYFLDAEGNRYTIDNLLVFPDQVPAAPIEQLGAELETAITPLGLGKQNIHFCKSHASKTRSWYADYNEKSKWYVVSVF